MGSFGQKNATSTATQQLPGYLQNAYQGIVGQAGTTAQTPYQPYTGGFTPDQSTAFKNIGSLWGSSNPQFGAANSALTNALTPANENVQQYMSPYNQAVIDATQKQFALQNAQEQQGVVGNAIAKGAYGGNRVGVAQGQLAGQQQTAQAPIIAGLYNSNYAQALAAAQKQQQTGLDAAAGFGNLGSTQLNSNLAQTGAQLGAGTQQQQFDYQQYLNQTGFPYQQQSWLASILGGLAPSAGGTTTESKPAGNIFSQILGAGLDIASLFKDGGVVPRGDYADGGVAHIPGQFPTITPDEEKDKGPDIADIAKIAMMFAASGGVVPRTGYAGGGDIRPFANDNGLWAPPTLTGSPYAYANDNTSFPPYIPQMAIAGGRGGFPTISADAPSRDEDPMHTDSGKKGATNIKNWLSGKATGGVVPADGGLRGYAGGGFPLYTGPNDPNDPTDPANWRGPVSDFYADIPNPKGRPFAAPIIGPGDTTVDAVNPIDASRLGLGMGNTSSEPPPLAYSDTPDDMGINQPSLHPVGLGAAPRAPSGIVPFSSGEQFTTTPAPGYSQNIGDVLASLKAGNGLNLSPDARQALLAAGAGMMSSQSPFFGGGIGEGVQKGIDTWSARQKLEADLANQRGVLAKTGSDIALQARQAGLLEAQTGREAQATQIDKWDFTPSMAGMVIKDRVDPSNSFVLPYDKLAGWAVQNGIDPSRLPQPAKPELGPDGVSMHVDPPLTARPSSMGFSAPEIIKEQTAAGLTSARSAYTAAQEAGVQLGLMKEAAKTLPSTGLLSQGTWGEERTKFAKQANSLSQMLGMEPVFDPNAVSASEELHKLTTQFGFALSRTTGSDIASSVVNQAVGAVPSIENTPQGFDAVVSSIQAGLNRQKDYYQFLQKWAAQTGGDITGADEYFNQVAPPSSYANAAILSAAIVPKTQAEIDNAPAGTLFNVNGKLMQK